MALAVRGEKSAPVRLSMLHPKLLTSLTMELAPVFWSTQFFWNVPHFLVSEPKNAGSIREDTRVDRWHYRKKKKKTLRNPNMRNLARIEYHHPKSELCFNETGGLFCLAREPRNCGITPWKLDILCKES